MINAKLRTVLVLSPLLLLLAPPLVFTLAADTLPPPEETSVEKLDVVEDVHEEETAEEVSQDDGQRTAQELPPEEGHYTGPCMGKRPLIAPGMTGPTLTSRQCSVNHRSGLTAFSESIGLVRSGQGA